MLILRVANWAEFQHYKDRAPPWIKLHFALLTSKTWVMLADPDRVLAIACMLLASRSDLADGQFDADPDYVQRAAYLHERPNYKPLISSGFLEVVQADASLMQADASALLATARPEESRDRAETEQSRDRGEAETESASVRKRPQARFVRPSLDEVRAYCIERQNTIDPQSFLDYYDANGWRVGKNAMKDWKAAVRTWERNGITTGRTGIARTPEQAVADHDARIRAKTAEARALLDRYDAMSTARTIDGEVTA